MPIKPPTFNYGGGSGSNLMSAAIGAALSKNRGPSFAQTLYRQKQQQSFLTEEREKAAINAWITGREVAKMEGRLLDPSIIQSDPTFAGRDIPIRTSSLLGLMPDLTEKDLRDYNIGREQLTVRYADPYAVAQAREVYNPLAVQFEATGPVDPATFTPEINAYLSQNPDVRDRMVKVDQGLVDASIQLAIDMEMPEFAEEIRTMSTRGLSFSQLQAIRTRMQDRSAVTAEGRAVTAEERAEATLKLNRAQSGRDQQRLQRELEEQEFELASIEIGATDSWMNLYRNSTDIGAYAIANNGMMPPADRTLSRTEAQIAAEIERQMGLAEGTPEIESIITDILQAESPTSSYDPLEVLKYTAIYNSFTPTLRRGAGTGGSGTGYRATTGTAWKPINDDWGEAAVKANPQKQNERVDSIRAISNGFIENPSAWEMFRTAFPHKDLPEDPPSVAEVDQLIWDLIISEGNQGGTGLIVDIYQTDTPHTANEIITRMMNGILNGRSESVPTTNQLWAYRSARAARGDEVMGNAHWGELFQASTQYHLGWSLRESDPTASQAHISSASVGIKTIISESQAAGESYTLQAPEGEGARTKQKSFVDERIEELARPSDDSPGISNMWSGNQVRDLMEVTYSDIEAFEVARLWKSWHGNEAKQKKYQEILTTIVEEKYDEGDLPGLLDELMLLTDRGDYAADEKYKVIFDMVKEWVTRPSKRDNLDGWDSRWLRPLKIALYMIEYDSPDVVDARKAAYDISGRTKAEMALGRVF